MDEKSLRVLLDEAISEEPPVGAVVPGLLSAGRTLRRRRRIRAAAGSALAVAVVAAAIPAAHGVLSRPPQPASPAVRPGMVYIATGALTVLPINLATRTALAPIKLSVPGSSTGMAISPDGRTVYVASARGYVTPISTATDRAGRPLWAGGVPGQIVVPPRSLAAYVLDDDSGLVVLDRQTGTQLGHIKIRGANDLAMTPDGKMAYVSTFDLSADIVPVDLLTDTALAPIRLPTKTLIQELVAAPHSAIVDAVGSTFLQPNDITLFRIDTATDTLLKPIRVRSSFGNDVVVAPNGSTAYLPGSSGLTPIDLTTGTVLPSIRLPAWQPGYELAVSPDGGTVYAMQASGSRVFPVDIATGSVLAPIRLGHPGFAAEEIVVAPDGDVLVGRWDSSTGPFLNDNLVQLIHPATGKVTTFLITHGKAGNGGPGPMVFGG